MTVLSCEETTASYDKHVRRVVSAQVPEIVD